MTIPAIQVQKYKRNDPSRLKVLLRLMVTGRQRQRDDVMMRPESGRDESEGPGRKSATVSFEGGAPRKARKDDIVPVSDGE
jgi:hypothetical protein